MLGRIVSDLIPNIARQRVIVLCILSTLISVVFMAACAGTKTELDFTSTQSLGVSNFQYSYLKIRPIEATPNERVLIDLDLTNTSGIEDSYSVELKINGAVEFTKNVDVPPGETWRLTFSAPTETEGIYEVTAGELTGRYVVRELILSSPDPAAATPRRAASPTRPSRAAPRCRRAGRVP